MGGGIGRRRQNCAWAVGSGGGVHGHGHQEEGQNSAEDEGTGDFI